MTITEVKTIDKRKRIQNLLLVLAFPVGIAMMLGNLLILISSGLINRMTPGNDGNCRIGIGGCCVCEEPCVQLENCMESCCCCDTEEPCVGLTRCCYNCCCDP